MDRSQAINFTSMKNRSDYCFCSNGRGNPIAMANPEEFEARFTEVFQPIFLWGVGAFELMLVIYTVYMEFVAGAGPSLLSTILPLSVVIAIAWAVLAVLITLAVIRIKRRPHQTEQ